MEGVPTGCHRKSAVRLLNGKAVREVLVNTAFLLAEQIPAGFNGAAVPINDAPDSTRIKKASAGKDKPAEAVKPETKR
jgi:hypothetical protein